MNFGLALLHLSAKWTGLEVFSRRNKALVLLICTLVAGLCLWGLVAGLQASARADEKHECDKRAASLELTQVAQAALDYQRGVKDGENKVRLLNEQLLVMHSQNETLKERLANVPRFIKSAACPDPDRVSLTTGGMRQLNTALGYPELPAGSCGPDGTPASACALDSGITVGELERNAQRNYETSAEIRARCQALIDHVRTFGESNVSTK